MVRQQDMCIQQRLESSVNMMMGTLGHGEKVDPQRLCALVACMYTTVLCCGMHTTTTCRPYLISCASASHLVLRPNARHGALCLFCSLPRYNLELSRPFGGSRKSKIEFSHLGQSSHDAVFPGLFIYTERNG